MLSRYEVLHYVSLSTWLHALTPLSCLNTRSDTSQGHLAVNIHPDWNAGGNNSDRSLPGLEDDADIGRAHVCPILSLPRPSHSDGILPESVLWLKRIWQRGGLSSFFPGLDSLACSLCPYAIHDAVHQQCTIHSACVQGMEQTLS